MNTKIKKGIFSAVLFVVLVTLTFYIIFKDNSIVQIFEIIKNVDIKFIILAILCMSVFVISEGVNIARTLKLLDCDISFFKGIKYALVGFFFSSVTPSASGGDPMQIYYMTKDNLPIGKSALAILTEFSSFQIVTILMSIIGLILNYYFIENSIGNIKYLMLLGVLINTLILVVIILSCFPNKIITKLLDILVKFLEKIHYKKTEEFRDKCLCQINEYQSGAKLLKSHKRVFAKILCTTTIQIILYHSIPYFIYLSFGLRGASYLQFLAVQAVLYISVSSIPLPRSCWNK